MSRFLICLTSERQEAANATRWARDNNTTQIAMTSRNREALANTRNGDVVIIVAHGSNTEVGTSSGRVTYTPATLAALLVGTMLMRDGVRVVLAACSSDQFATGLEAAIHAAGLGNVTCEGQAGSFAFGADFAV